MTKRKKITLLNPSKDKVYIDRYALSLSGYVVLGEAATVKLTAKINSTLDRMFVERIVSNAFPLGAVINGLTDGKSYFLLLGSTEYLWNLNSPFVSYSPIRAELIQVCGGSSWECTAFYDGIIPAGYKEGFKYLLGLTMLGPATSRRSKSMRSKSMRSK